MKQYLFLVLLALSSGAFAQSILGSYEQLTLSAPANFKQSEQDVKVSRDPQASKKIWISGLIPNQRFYALLDTKTEDGAVYSVPKQKAGNFEIALGCIVYQKAEEDADEDDEAAKDRIVISLNNKRDCQSYLDGPIEVGPGGVTVGDIKVGKDGNVKAGGTQVGKDGSVKVDTKGLFEGVAYIGVKQ